MDYVKSPLNYIGGKYAILPQIIPLFPKNVDTFLDIFAGGANVGINISAKKIILNDNLTFLMDLYFYLSSKEASLILDEVDSIIKEYNLSLSNQLGYNKLREDYNVSKKPIQLLVLSFYSFNHQIRFNNNHDFNTPFGKNRSQYNGRIKNNLEKFIELLREKDISITKYNFDEYDYSSLGSNDFIYCDPPYLITTGTYNDGKRGFTGWDIQHEQRLLGILDELNSKNIRFALSNVIYHKGLKNDLLLEWIKKNGYKVHNIDKNYTNASYHAKHRDKNETQEVLITNY